ncbi:unnamed protein product, partial [Mesorhabditis spiculigera]
MAIVELEDTDGQLKAKGHYRCCFKKLNSRQAFGVFIFYDVIVCGFLIWMQFLAYRYHQNRHEILQRFISNETSSKITAESALPAPGFLVLYSFGMIIFGAICVHNQRSRPIQVFRIFYIIEYILHLVAMGVVFMAMTTVAVAIPSFALVVSHQEGRFDAGHAALLTFAVFFWLVPRIFLVSIMLVGLWRVKICYAYYTYAYEKELMESAENPAIQATTA